MVPSCPAASAKFPTAQAESGRKSKSTQHMSQTRSDKILQFVNFQIVIQLLLFLVVLWISCTTTIKSTNSRILSVTVTHSVRDADVGKLQVVLLGLVARGVVHDDHVVDAVLARGVYHRRRLEAVLAVDELVREAAVGQQHLRENRSRNSRSILCSPSTGRVVDVVVEYVMLT